MTLTDMSRAMTLARRLRMLTEQGAMVGQQQVPRSYPIGIQVNGETILLPDRAMAQMVLEIARGQITKDIEDTLAQLNELASNPKSVETWLQELKEASSELRTMEQPE